MTRPVPRAGMPNAGAPQTGAAAPAPAVNTIAPVAASATATPAPVSALAARANFLGRMARSTAPARRLPAAAGEPALRLVQSASTAAAPDLPALHSALAARTASGEAGRTVPGAAYRDINALPEELVLQIMREAHVVASRLGQTCNRYYDILEGSFRQILFPRLHVWTANLQQALQHVRLLDDAALAGLALFDVAQDPLVRRSALENLCNTLALVVEMGSSHFTAANLPRLHTASGFDEAVAHYAFLYRFGAQDALAPAAGVVNDALLSKLLCAIPASDFSTRLEQQAASQAQIKRALDGLLGLLGAQAFHEGRLESADDAVLLRQTLQAHELVDPSMTALLKQPDGPWFAAVYPRAHTLQTFALAMPGFNAWMLHAHSPWPGLDPVQRLCTIDLAALGHHELGAWLLQAHSPWCAMTAQQMGRTLAALDINLAALAPVLTGQHALWRAMLDETASHQHGFWEEDQRLAALTPAQRSRFTHPVNRAWQGVDLLALQAQTVGQALAAITAHQQTFSPALHESLMRFVMIHPGMWDIIHPAQETALALSAFNRKDANFCRKRAAHLIACLESGNARILEWMVQNAATLPGMNTQLQALALAAQSGSQAFIEHVLDQRLPLADRSENQLVACKEIFCRAGTAMLDRIMREPQLLVGLQPGDVPIVLKFETLDPAMIVHVHSSQPLRASADPGAALDALDNAALARFRHAAQAFELNNDVLSGYVLDGERTWSRMSAAQMAQTVRAFAIGNAGLTRQIRVNREGKRLHQVSADEMRERNDQWENAARLAHHKP
ncbi:MAG: hypothetical protein ACRYGK_16070 [Janthinobacterium lividum]